ncbi:hypothetical protein [Zhihengliuella flava]|uniref:Uncharacterized protein n=1 Tax=Zhihengliuella flava TaxID=1285193 RepID=A0A931DEJ0_9MICC|nr:hypothetical protein [Zhihengliuella flava]MBG6085365.1 hypothetical protein [Zhihengliuella flava]
MVHAEDRVYSILPRKSNRGDGPGLPCATGAVLTGTTAARTGVVLATLHDVSPRGVTERRGD